MPTPDDIQRIVDLGGLALFVVVVTLIGWGAVKERPWWVPGSVYRREVETSDKASTQAERTADAMERIVKLLGLPPDDGR